MASTSAASNRPFGGVESSTNPLRYRNKVKGVGYRTDLQEHNISTRPQASKLKYGSKGGL